MDDFFFLLAILVGGFLLIAPILGIIGFFRSLNDRVELEVLRAKIERLAAELAGLRDPLQPAVPEAAPKSPPLPEPPLSVQAPPPPEPAFDQVEAPKAPAPSAAPAPTARRAGSLEESLTSRWLVWLGAATLALAGVFLVKYSIDRGFFGPGVRIAMGLAMAALLVAGGEWLRRRPLQQAIASLKPDYVPPALAGAGLFTAFASVYAAYGLYDFLSPMVAFVLLALLAFGGFALALLQGPFIAVLALLGGFATPLLVSTGNPMAWGLFPYLTVLIAAALALVRLRTWWWLSWGVLAGAALWVLIWFVAAWRPGDGVAVGLFLLLLAGAFLLVRHGRGASIELVTWQKGFKALAKPELVACCAAAVVAVLTFVLVRVDGYQTASLMTWAALAILFLAIGYREAVFDALGLLAALLTTALVATRHLPQIVTAPEPYMVIDGQVHGYVPGPLLPPELAPFLLMALGFAALFGGLCFVALWGARRPGLWASLSVGLPLLLLVVAYWRVTGFAVDLKWSATSLALGGLFLVAATPVERHRAARGLDLVLGLYAAGVVAALSFALAMALEEAWLTAALSLQLPALAWIHDRLRLRPMRMVALVVAALVLVRLALNPYVLDYSLGSIPGLNWTLYGYGLPAAAFWYALRRFRRSEDDLLVMVLEAGTLALVTLLITFEIRSLVAGSLASPDYRLLERALQSTAWLALAYGLLLQYRKHARKVMFWGWRILAGLAAGQTLLLQLLLRNPLWSGESVGAWPILDVLLLAYLLPAGFALLFAREFRRTGQEPLAKLAGAAGLVLIFVYLSLEVRHWFHGPVLSHGRVSDGETYTYSLVWLGFALALLGAGLRSGIAALRYASLVVLLGTVAKVFLIDMAALSGLLRVASFLGLGFSLVGIGFFYQRFVFPPRGGKTGEAPQADGRPLAMS